MDRKIIGAVAALALIGAGTGAIAVSGGGGGSGSQQVAVTTASFTLPSAYTFRTIDDHADPTFNQLLGINNHGVIAGYFGSGAAGHPNKGYAVSVGAQAFHNENAPHSLQTQVTGLNDRGVTVGFSAPTNNANQVNANVGFVAVNGHFRPVAFPTTNNATPPVNQLLGINNDGTAIGFYTDANGNNHGYRYDTTHNRFHKISITGATSTTAAAIDNDNDVAGFFTNAAGVTDGFLLQDNGHTSILAFPGATATQPFGVNDHREVVGAYTLGTGANATTHGFVWTTANGFRTVDDPAGVGTTTVNGVNNAGQLVGFYQDAAGNTHGMLATPRRTPTTTSHLTLQATPVGTVTIAHTANGTFTAHLNLFGLTPGSSHDTAISRGLSTVVRFPQVTADGGGRIQTTITSVNTARELPSGSQFTIRLGTGNVRNSLAAQVIARSGVLPTHPGNGTESRFYAVAENSDHATIGRLTGNVTMVFDATAHTLTLTVTATGLTPGAHAAHIHIGTCSNQGAVQYMIMDLQADAHGDVVNQTRVVTGVTTMPQAGTRYLNIHQGDSNSILTNGAPALPFRPLLCANF